MPDRGLPEGTSSVTCAECSSLGMDSSAGSDPVMPDAVPVGSLTCSHCRGPWPRRRYRGGGIPDPFDAEALARAWLASRPPYEGELGVIRACEPDALAALLTRVRRAALEEAAYDIRALIGGEPDDGYASYDAAYRDRHTTMDRPTWGECSECGVAIAWEDRPCPHCEGSEK